MQIHLLPRALCTALLFFAAACGCPDNKSSLRYTSQLSLDKAAPGFQALYGALPAAMRKDFVQTHSQINELIKSDEFRALLEDIEVVFSHPGSQPISGHRLAAIYQGHQVPGVSHRKICYKFKEGGRVETANSGFGREAACQPGELAIVTMRTVTVERSHSAVLEEKACAINTFAHELAHTINDAQDGMVFTDRGYQKQSSPLASYVLGSVAQCLYLSKSYSPGAFDIRRCIEEVGSNGFDHGSCESGWASRFTSPSA